MRVVVRRIVSHLRAPFLVGSLAAFATYSAACDSTNGRAPIVSHADAGKANDGTLDATIRDAGHADPQRNEPDSGAHTNSNPDSFDAGHVPDSVDASHAPDSVDAGRVPDSLDGGHDLDSHMDAGRSIDFGDDDAGASLLGGEELVGDYPNARGGEGAGSCPFSVGASGQFTIVYPLFTGGRLDISSATRDPEGSTSPRHLYYEATVGDRSYAVRVDKIDDGFIQAAVYWDGLQWIICRTGADISLSDWLELASHAGHYGCMTDSTINRRGAGTRWPAELVVDAMGGIRYIDSTGNIAMFSHDNGDPIILTREQNGTYFAVGYATILQIDVDFEAAYLLIGTGSESQEYCTDLALD